MCVCVCVLTRKSGFHLGPESVRLDFSCWVLCSTGGHDGSSYLNSVERYDPRTNQWASSPAPTSSCRTSVGVGVLEGCVYAVGGQDGVSCLNIAER